MLLPSSTISATTIGMPILNVYVVPANPDQKILSNPCLATLFLRLFSLPIFSNQARGLTSDHSSPLATPWSYFRSSRTLLSTSSGVISKAVCRHKPFSPCNPFVRALFLTTSHIAMNKMPLFAEPRSGSFRDASPLEDHRMHRPRVDPVPKRGNEMTERSITPNQPNHDARASIEAKPTSSVTYVSRRFLDSALSGSANSRPPLSSPSSAPELKPVVPLHRIASPTKAHPGTVSPVMIAALTLAALATGLGAREPSRYNSSRAAASHTAIIYHSPEVAPDITPDQV